MSRAELLSEDVCVVTGGGQGIGAKTAEILGAEGARVAILDRDEKLAAACCAELETIGIDARPYRADVANERDVSAAAAQVHDDFGRVDVLINNAGISLLGPSMDFSLEDWQASLDVMATGVFLCSREFGKIFRANGGGVIVNISSLNGVVAFPMRLAYSAAKAAVVSMTKVLAVEWASYGIRVNAVAPGITETGMLTDAVAQEFIDVDTYQHYIPMNRFAKPEEIANAVLFLATQQSSYFTGQVLVPDGGWSSTGWVPWSGDPEAPGLGIRQ